MEKLVAEYGAKKIYTPGELEDQQRADRLEDLILDVRHTCEGREQEFLLLDNYNEAGKWAELIELIRQGLERIRDED